MNLHHLLLILTLTPWTSTESITVLQTTRNLSIFTPNSGAELRFSSLLGQEDVTICARFNTYQFTTNMYSEPLQLLLVLGDNYLLGSYTMLPPPSPWYSYFHDRIGGKWQNGNAMGFGLVNELLNVFPVWKPGGWNHVCIIASSTERNYKTVINGDDVYEGLDFTADLRKVDKNLTFMGSMVDKEYESSLFGRMTDINIWNRSFTEEDVMQWTKCEMKEGGDIVDWSTAQWKAVGLEEVMVHTSSEQGPS